MDEVVIELLTVVPESRILVYGGDSGSSVEMEPLSDCSGDGDAAHFLIDDTGIGILFIVLR